MSSSSTTVRVLPDSTGPSTNKSEFRIKLVKYSKTPTLNHLLLKMRGRRRFHGYCPPAARRTSNAVLMGSPDDYTSTMSGMSIRVNAKPSEIAFVKENSRALMPSSDTETDDDDSSVAEIADIIQSVGLGIRRRNGSLPESNDGIVTSLSYDSRDETPLAYALPPRKLTILTAPEEDDEARDICWLSGTDIIEPEQFEIDTPESTVVSVEDQDVDTDDLPADHSKGSFMAFRINYLIVTVAIMLADGLQGKENALFACSPRFSCDIRFSFPEHVHMYTTRAHSFLSYHFVSLSRLLSYYSLLNLNSHLLKMFSPCAFLHIILCSIRIL